ncbi:Signal transduction histidine kinase [Alteromonadaceae bacterium Bs31]|nr:Signal transduction histidine kinase [Alteromonadaceae bacterium Bs31]
MAKNKNETIMRVSGLATWLVIFVVDALMINEYQALRVGLYLAYLLCFLLTSIPSMGVIHSPGYTYALVLQLLIALTLYLLDPNSVIPILFVIWVSLLPETMPARRWLLVWLLLNGFLIGYDFVDGASTSSVVTSFVFMGFQLFAAGSSQIRISARQNKEKLEQTHLALVATQSLLAEQSQAQARLSISRDLHDSIGHKLTVLSLNIEHAIHRTPQDTTAFHRSLKASVNETLEELRQIVREVRETKNSSLDDVLKALTQALPDGVQVNYPENLEVGAVDVRDQLAFCIQEGISNALRHGRATALSIVCESTSPFILQLEDNGSVAYLGQEGSGIKGMKERLKPFGGQVSLSPLQNRRGTQLTLRVPAMTQDEND